MLVLSRRAGESVVIGHEVTVTVLEVRGDVVRLGIDAPRSVQVHREEVYRELQAQNAAAAAAPEEALEALAARLTGGAGGGAGAAGGPAAGSGAGPGAG